MADSRYLWYSDRKDYVLFAKRQLETSWNTELPHVHNSVEFAIGLAGCSHLYIEDKKYELTEGKVFFMNRFERHKYDYCEGTKCYIIVITSSFFDDVNELGKLSFPTLMEDRDSFNKIKEYLDICFSMQDMDSMLFKTGFVNTFISFMKRLFPYTIRKESMATGEICANMMQYISEHYKEDISIESISKKFGYSPNYLSSVFNKYVGTGFREQLNRFRIFEYTSLKKNTPGLSTSKAAEMCGFKNMKTFYNALEKAKEEMEFRDNVF